MERALRPIWELNRMVGVLVPFLRCVGCACSYYPAVRTYCVQTVYNSTAGNRPMYTIYFVHS